jgi:hypothetical protein
MRRKSLADEVQGKDPHYAEARIQSVLNGLQPDERTDFLDDFNKRSASQSNKTFFMAQLLDALFDRKEKVFLFSQ